MHLFVGSGRLTSALLSFFRKQEEKVGVFGRNPQTASDLAAQYAFVEEVNETAFSQATHVYVCLPKDQYAPFFQSYSHWFAEGAAFYFFATAAMEKEVREWIPFKRVVPCKVVGHAKQMAEDHKGLLVIPEHHEKERDVLRRFFGSGIDVVLGEEQTVLQANTIATKAVLEMMVELRALLQEANVPPDWHNHICEQTVRGVAKAYVKNDLGGFARAFLKDEMKVGDHET
ncbi:NAD(P)-binding domain-containing protein [Halalkalibacterium ligniniphilum]|uniref:NAD(P)-binding domain-containing protein n=1 Tax=Halalkalibacterium ligniniphilum TaxID=1134413 RepID=UPI00034DB638|nr:NAD(P)-binding domain-containing protein [Halalkalibacterium ligniniphilum]